MLIRRLQLQSFRRFAEAELHPQPGFNLITGDNGSGKTSLLEAVHLLAHGRSFRGRVRDGLIRREQPALSVFAEWRAGTGSSHRAGLRHTGGDWEGFYAQVEQLAKLPPLQRKAALRQWATADN